MAAAKRTPPSITAAVVLDGLRAEAKLKARDVAEAISRLGYDPDKIEPMTV